MNRYVTFEPGEFYHIFNRGVNKEKIFYSEGDWTYFQRLLYLRNDSTGYVRPERVKNMSLKDISITEPLVDIQAYALMPNHFHFLVSERRKGGISLYMKRLLTSYSMYMNKKYDRSGPLMCRPFRSRHVPDNDYLRWLISYIHLNPLDLTVPNWREKGIRDSELAHKYLKNYSFSSYQDYYGEERDEAKIINKDSLHLDGSVEDFSNLLRTYNLRPDKVAVETSPFSPGGS